MAQSASRIGILEDDPLLRGFLVDVVAAADDLIVVFAVDTVAEAKRQFDAQGADLVLVDLRLPDGSGLDFIHHAGTAGGVRILVLTVLGDRANVMEALKSGANGYLLKDTPADQIEKNIRQTLEGFTPISPQVANYLVELLKPPAAWVPVVPGDETFLTEREAEVLALFSRGLTYREAAHVMNISPHTVSDFVKKIYRKLSVSSRSEAVFEARQMGLIERDG
jgi:DNA-binding NarL/FixJ family response regulator